MPRYVKLLVTYIPMDDLVGNKTNQNVDCKTDNYSSPTRSISTIILGEVA
jgi:hypothetical protein